MGHGHYRRTGLLFRAEARALVFRDDGNTKCGPDDNFCDWGDICCRSGRRSCNKTRRKRESAAQPRATTELHCAESNRLLLRDPGGTTLIQLEISEIGARVLIRHIHDAESQPGIDIFRNIFGIGVKIRNGPDSPRILDGMLQQRRGNMPPSETLIHHKTVHAGVPTRHIHIAGSDQLPIQISAKTRDLLTQASIVANDEVLSAHSTEAFQLKLFQLSGIWALDGNPRADAPTMHVNVTGKSHRQRRLFLHSKRIIQRLVSHHLEEQVASCLLIGQRLPDLRR